MAVQAHPAHLRPGRSGQRGRPKKLLEWAHAYRRSKGAEITACPRCLAQQERLPANRRKLHRLPCPVHGAFELHQANRAAWQIVRQYGVQLLRMQRDAGFKHPLIAPDFQALDVILRLSGCADVDTLQQVVTLLNEGVIPLMT